MDILITGSSGQLGKDFINYYSQDDKINLWYPSHEELDIVDNFFILKYLENKHIDIIINCAAYTAVDKAESEWQDCILINQVAVQKLAAICKQKDITLIQISTDYVFDGMSEDIYTEESTTHPISFYGMTKKVAEDYIIKNLTKYYIIRTSWLFGVNGKSNYVKTMINLLKTKGELNIVYDEIGSPTFTEDLVSAIDKLKDTNDYGIYNIHNDGFISRYEFTEEIAKQINSNTKLNKISLADYNKDKQVAKRPLNNKLSIDKISKYYKMPNWKAALNRYLIETEIYNIPFVKENNITDIKKISYKSSHLNYLLDNKYVIKIFDPWVSLEQVNEAVKAIKILEQANIKTKKVLSVGKIFNNTYIISEYLTGVLLNDIYYSYSESEKIEAGKKFAQLIRNIHENTNKLVQDTNEIRSCISQILKIIDAYNSLTEKSIYNFSNESNYKFNIITRDFKELMNNIKVSDLSIVNYDTNLYNILIDNTDLVLIDWEDLPCVDSWYFALREISDFDSLFRSIILKELFPNNLTIYDKNMLKLIMISDALVHIWRYIREDNFSNKFEEMVNEWFNKLYDENGNYKEPVWLKEIYEEN